MIVVDAARELGQIVRWAIAVIAGPSSGSYGGFDLREGDRDPAAGAPARYGGEQQPGAPAASHVADLHRDLRTLGFLVAPDGATTFDRRTRWAVQEFQRYAALHGAAVEAAGTVTTTAGITDARTTVPVTSTDGLPAAVPFPVRIDAEILTVTGGLGTTELTVTRATAGTAAAAHAQGAVVRPARWSDRLRPEPAWFYERYPREATGVVNAWTRMVLDRWLAEGWRCPIVVEAWDMAGGVPDRLHVAPGGGFADNLWLHTDLPVGAPRMFARDLTATWPRPVRPPVSPAHPELDPVGEWTTALGFDGPLALPERHTWHPEGEMLPENLLPRPAPDAAAPALGDLVRLRDDAGAAAGDRERAGRQLSTFKVVRAVAEVEAVGFFDGVNGWDNAFLSLGPCHWTAGPIAVPAAPQPPRPTWNVRDGELWAYLSYLQAADPAAWTGAVGRFGLEIDDPWGTDGRNLFLPTQDRKYVSRPAVPQEEGVPQQVQQIVAEFDVFRSWHWFYRFVMAGRTIDGFRRRMWHMARLRLRDILATPWDTPGAAATLAAVPDPAAPGGARPARIGDVLGSERSVAFAYRWHILSPAGMVSGGRAGNALRSIVAAAAAAGPNFAGSPAGWTDAHEAALVVAFPARAAVLFPPAANGNPSSMVTTLATVDNWPAWGANPRGFTLPVAALPAAERRLLTTRGSFRFDDSELTL
ncbi:hypothetical protein Asp14428_21190 [Actinoplanes sp. NBRC 14428]|nr:hypothetical protein Asp14428_21190 [Actinoplanes sp. NBRC 14428]